MKLDENWLKKKLKRELEAEGAHVYVTREMMKMGVPDLYIKHPHFPAVWAELKFVKGKKLGITPQQKKFLNAERTAGGHVGWIAAAEFSEGRILLIASSDVVETVDDRYIIDILKNNRAPIPIRRLLHTLTV